MRITGLYVYPVKGCQRIDLTSAQLTETGIAHDRSWMVVNPKGLFLTQRDVPRLACIATRFSGGGLELSCAGFGSISTSLSPSGVPRSVQVWHAKGTADDAGDDVATWLSAALGTPARLVRTGALWQRRLPGDEPLSFVDGYPFLLVSLASLDDLNGRLEQPVPMERFRPNIVVDGVAAYAEDKLESATKDSIVLRGDKLCVRCAVTTTDQTTGTRDVKSEPLRTLARYRRDDTLRGVVFGVNVRIAAGVGGVLELHDTLVTSFR